jgi:hypothetical protein
MAVIVNKKELKNIGEKTQRNVVKCPTTDGVPNDHLMSLILTKKINFNHITA